MEETCVGNETLVLPKPATPDTPFARPPNKEVGAQTKRKLGRDTRPPVVAPLEEFSWITSVASSLPLGVDLLVMGLLMIALHVFLLHPGLGPGGAGHDLHILALARAQSGEPQLTGLYVEET